MALEAFINGDKRKTAKQRGRTLRFDLELAPPTEEFTNEFSYTELVEGEERKGDGLPKIGETLEKGTDNQLAALAQRLEEKYGAPSQKKRKRQRVFESDLIDRGYGYDTNDLFVDDSEMYEDFVPPQVDTKFGGFYVNTGDLEFTSVRQTEWDEDMDDLAKKRKKPKMKKQSSHQTPQSILASQKLKKAKQHVAAQKVPKPKAGKVLFKTSSLATTSSSTSIFAKSPHKKPAGTKKKKEKGEGVILQPPAPSPSSLVGSLLATGQGVAGSPGVKSEMGGEQGVKKTGEGSEPPKPPPVLPEDLPEDISTTIQLFQESVARDQASTPEGKISFKTRGSYDEQLTELELACRKLPVKKRIAVLEFVSHKLGVSRATTIKRVRQVMKRREEEALVQPLQKLIEAVDASMPEQLQQYEQELRARAESLSAAGGDKVSVTPMEVDDDVTVDEVFEETSSSTVEMKEAAAKTKRAPRKKYKWTEETRHCLCEVVRIKVESEELMKGRVNGEEVLMEFLDTKVKPLWPKGWMQKSILYKLTEPVHRYFTNPQAKKAAGTAVKKPPPEKDKTTEQKKSDSSSLSQTAPGTAKRAPESRENSPHLSQLSQSPATSRSNSPKSRESPEGVQWSVKMVNNATTGSPITIVRKTAASVITSGNGRAGGSDASGSGTGVQITPRMAQLLSSVASSQALVKTSKTPPGSSSKTSPSPASLPVKKPEKSTKIELHTDVQALLSQFQSSKVKFVDFINTQSSSPSATVASSTPQDSSKIRQPLPHPSSSSPSSSSGSSSISSGKGVVSSARGSGGSGGRLSSPSSKITTSPIQMKAIVSQLKPKVPPQGKLAVTATHKQPSPPSHSLVTSQRKPTTSSSQKSSSVLQPGNPGPPKKVTKVSIAASSGPTIQLPKITSAFSLAQKLPPTTKLNQPVSSQNPFSATLSGKKQPDHGHSKKTSPPKGGRVPTESHAKPHPHATPTPRRPAEHSTIIHRSQIRSTSPLLANTHSSPPSTSSPSSQSHLPLSAIVHHISPSLQPSSPLPLLSATTGSSSRQATSNKLLATPSTIAAPEGSPITAVLVPQPQPTYAVVTSQPPQLLTQMEPSARAVGAESQFAATTIPFSSCASTFILTSPLSSGHFGHLHGSKATPPHTHQLVHHQTTPPHSLTISPPTVPAAGAQVVVAGVSGGTGVKSPVEQIYLEHSYGGQTSSEQTDTVDRNDNLSSRKLTH